MVTSDAFDLWLGRKPRLCGRWLTVGQQGDGPVPFGIADKRAVALIALPCPVIDPDHCGRSKARVTTPTDHSQQRILADRQHQPARKTGGRPPAKRKTEMVGNVVEP